MDLDPDVTSGKRKTPPAAAAERAQSPPATRSAARRRIAEAAAADAAPAVATIATTADPTPLPSGSASPASDPNITPPVGGSKRAAVPLQDPPSGSGREAADPVGPDVPWAGELRAALPDTEETARTAAMDTAESPASPSPPLTVPRLRALVSRTPRDTTPAVGGLDPAVVARLEAEEARDSLNRVAKAAAASEVAAREAGRDASLRAAADAAFVRARDAERAREAQDRAAPSMPVRLEPQPEANAWSAIDNVKVDYLLLCHVRFPNSVHPSLVEDWAAAYSAVLARVEEAQDSEERDRALLWYLGLHQFLLRKKPGKTLRPVAVTALYKERFEQFREGRFSELLDAWRDDVDTIRRSSAGPRREADAGAQISRARSLIAAGELSRAARLLCSKGVADTSDPGVSAQLAAKHPCRKAPIPFRLDGDFDGAVDFVFDLTEIYRTLDRRAGKGPDGMSNAHLLVLAREHRGEEARAVMERVSRFAARESNGDLPAWWYWATGAVKLTALVKKEAPAGGGVPDVRPIGAGNVRRRATARAIARALKDHAASLLAPNQFGVAVSDGVTAFAFALRAAIEVHAGGDGDDVRLGPEVPGVARGMRPGTCPATPPGAENLPGTPLLPPLPGTPLSPPLPGAASGAAAEPWIVIDADEKNAFNEVKRAVVIRELRKYPGMMALARYYFLWLSPMSYVVLSEAGLPKVAAFLSEEGGQQGDACFPMAYAFATLARGLALDRDVKAADPNATALYFADDGVVVAPATAALDAFERFGNAIVEDGRTISPTKSTVWCPALTVAEFAAHPALLGRVSREVDESGKTTFLVDGMRVVERGVTLCGVHVGEDEFVRQKISQDLSSRASKTEHITQLLAPYSIQDLGTVLRYCLAPTGDFIAAHQYPSDSRSDLVKFDKVISDAFRVSLGGAGPLVFEDPFAVRRLRLPVRVGGFGLRERAVQAPVAFLGRVAAAAPTVAKAVPGAMAALFGDGAFERKHEARYGRLVSGGSRLGREFAAAYAAVKRGVMESLRVTDVDDPALGLLRRPAASAGLALTPVAKGVPLAYALNLQSALTRAREAALLVALKRDVEALSGPGLDRRAASLLCTDRFSGQYLLCAASRIPLKNDEYAEIAANYVGLPSPACLKHPDAPVLGDPALRLDPHGDVLFKNPRLCNRGNRRTDWHNTVQALFVKGLKLAGVRVSLNVFNILSRAALDVNARTRLLSGMPFQSGHRRIVPDLQFSEGAGGMERLADVKTLSFTIGHYTRAVVYGPSSPVDRRALAVHPEYLAHARAIDREFAGGGPRAEGGIHLPGPMELAILAHGDVVGLAVGNFGEASTPCHQILNKVANAVGGEKWNDMGVASADDATHRVRNALYQEWGVSLARARARCLLSGLEFVGQNYPSSLSLSLLLQREAAKRRLVNDVASFGRGPSLSSPATCLFGRC